MQAASGRGGENQKGARDGRDGELVRCTEAKEQVGWKDRSRTTIRRGGWRPASGEIGARGVIDA